jgi:hypothetical protein
MQNVKYKMAARWLDFAFCILVTGWPSEAAANRHSERSEESCLNYDGG